MNNRNPEEKGRIVSGLQSLLADIRGGVEHQVRGGLRGLSDSGYGTASGAARILGQNAAADSLLSQRNLGRQFYGGSDIAAVGSRVVGDLAQFAAPGTALGKVAGVVPRVGQALKGSTAARIGTNLAVDVPVDAAIGASEREASIAGMLADMEGPEGSLRQRLGSSERLDRIAESPRARGALEAATGTIFGGAVLGAGEAIAGRAARREADRIARTQRPHLSDAEFANDLPEVPPEKRWTEAGRETPRQMSDILRGVDAADGRPVAPRRPEEKPKGRLRGLFGDNRGSLITAGEDAPSRNPYPGGEIPFYSRLEKAVESAPWDRGSPAQWKARLNKAPRGVAKGEREWTGIDSWLDTQTGSVSKEQVLEQARKNGIELDETRYRGTAKFTGYRMPGAEDESNYREVVVTLKGASPSQPKSLDDMSREQMIEWLARSDRHGIYRDADSIEEFGSVMSKEDAVLSMEKAAHDLEVSVEEMLRDNTSWAGDLDSYRSSHWDQLDNPLVHIRMGDRVIDGEKSLVVHEIQSDWHQAGRKQGYKGVKGRNTTLESTPEAQVLDEMGFQYTKAPDSHEFGWVDSETGDIHLSTEELGRVIRENPADYPGLDAQEVMDQAEDVLERARSLDISGVPNAPMKGTQEWVGLALRRIMKEAVEGGYQRVVLPTGAQAAEMFDLRQMVDEIGYNPTTKRLTARDANTGRNLIDERNVSPEKLADFVGQAPAQRLLAATPGDSSMGITEDAIREYRHGYELDLTPTENELLVELEGRLRYGTGWESAKRTLIEQAEEGDWYADEITGEWMEDYLSRVESDMGGSMVNATGGLEGWHFIKEDDLALGGEGMEAFYDKIVPQVFKKEAKALGVNIEFEETLEIDGVPSFFRITPELSSAARSEGFRVNSAEEVGGALLGGAIGAGNVNEDDSGAEVGLKVVGGALGGGLAGRTLRGLDDSGKMLNPFADSQDSGRLRGLGRSNDDFEFRAKAEGKSPEGLAAEARSRAKDEAGDILRRGSDPWSRTGAAFDAGAFRRGSGVSRELDVGNGSTIRVEDLNYTPEARRAAEDAGVRNVDSLIRVDSDTAGATEFARAISDAKAQDPAGLATVDAYAADGYEGLTLLMTPDRKSGVAVRNGEIVSLFKDPRATEAKGVMRPLLAAAVQAGGRNMDAFDTYLTDLYRSAGFKPVKRMKFDESVIDPLAADGLRQYNGGQPDVISWTYDPAPAGAARRDPSTMTSEGGEYVEDYGEMVDAAANLRPFEERMQVNPETGRYADLDTATRYDGKAPAEWEREDLQAYVTDQLGPRAADRIAGSSEPVTIRQNDGREVNVPGGLEGEFTYYDLLTMKAQGINPNELDEATSVGIMKKLGRTMNRESSEPDPMQVFRGLLFGITSPNSPLTPNEFTVSRLMPRDMEDVRRLAATDAGEMPRRFGIQAGDDGGIGTRGSVDYENVRNLAELFEQDPKWFVRRDGEPWKEFVERLSNQTRGLSSKTGSFGSVWQNLAEADISAIDRHMARAFIPFLEDAHKAEVGDKAVAFWNKLKKRPKNPETNVEYRPEGWKKVKSSDAMMELEGSDRIYDQALQDWITKTKTAVMRGKDGTINPRVPEHLRPENARYIDESKITQVAPSKGDTRAKIAMMGEPYDGALAINRKNAHDKGLSVFLEQWRLWDQYRGRLEPHEVMFPEIAMLPRMGHEDVAAALERHKDLRYLDGKLPKVGRTERPMELAYWGLAGLGGGVAAAKGKEKQEPRLRGMQPRG